MAVPKKKYGKSRQGKRRSHLGISKPALDICPQCHSPKLSHHVCSSCGHYNSRQVMEVESTARKG